MNTTTVKEKFYAAIEMNTAGKMNATETEAVVRHLYGVVQEISDAKKDAIEKSDAHLDRFEMRQTLRQYGIEVEY